MKRELNNDYASYLPRPGRAFVGCMFVLGLALLAGCSGQQYTSPAFEKDNLLAWCIVPFDAEQRGPEARAAMLEELGITMLAYDWRNEHIPTFDDEWKALNRHNITLQGFWMMTGKDPEHDEGVEVIFDFLERNNVRTQLWLFVTEWEGFDGLRQEEKLEAVAQRVAYITDRAAALGCDVGLYNHRGWFGEPENQLAIIGQLNRPNIGIVYNFHHAVKDHERFSEFFPKIKPHLYALNLAGIRASDDEQFYGLGEGDIEQRLIRIVLESDYDGPVGIINHDRQRDARVGLLKEMEGLKAILTDLGAEKTLKTY